jgi:hypothetical protein
MGQTDGAAQLRVGEAPRQGLGQYTVCVSSSQTATHEKLAAVACSRHSHDASSAHAAGMGWHPMPNVVGLQSPEKLVYPVPPPKQ